MIKLLAYKFYKSVKYKSHNWQNIRFNKKLKKFKFSSNSLVLGNGPSLSNLLLLHKFNFESYDLFVSNYFYKSPNYLEMNIVGYFIMDPLPCTNINDSITIIENALLNKSLKYLVIHKTVFTELRRIKYTLDSKIIPFDCSKVKHSEIFESDNLADKYSIMFNQTPLLPLFLSVQQNYNEIYIAGLDHNALFNFANSKYDVDHFYFEKNTEKQIVTRKWWEMVIITGQTFEQYLSIKKFADRKKIKIYNLSNESHLGMFEYINANDL